MFKLVFSFFWVISLFCPQLFFSSPYFQFSPLFKYIFLKKMFCPFPNLEAPLYDPASSDGAVITKLQGGHYHIYVTVIQWFYRDHKTILVQNQVQTWWLTWDSQGVNAMLISFRVLIRLAASELQISLNFSSGRAKQNGQTQVTQYTISAKLNYCSTQLPQYLILQC